MLNKLFQKTIYEDLVVIDSTFPQKEPRAFRNSEINQYFERINNFSSYAMYPMQPDKHAWFSHGYGVDVDTFQNNLDGYLKRYPRNKGRIHHLQRNKKYRFKLAYSFFLAETYVLLPFYEKHKIPFVFVLYPGGGFGLDFDKSDMMLKKIFSSKYFKGVIVTQPVTYDYLTKKEWCPVEKIHYIYGSFVQFKKEDVKPKLYYKNDKNTFDICFVGHKYSEKGVDKGYDLFIETAKKLSELTEDIMFHVVGGFSPDDIDLGIAKERVKFHGVQPPNYLREFYSSMDILLSPNRPFKLYEGNFDGFPIGADAGYCGVARFVSDELKSNRHFKEDKDIVIIPLDSSKIADKILYYYKSPEKLYKLSKLGQERTQELWDINIHIDKRISIFQQYIDLDLKNVVKTGVD